MGIIGQGIDALGTTLGNIVFVGSDGIFVTLRCVVETADSAEDMRRHMNQVTGAGRQC